MSRFFSTVSSMTANLWRASARIFSFASTPASNMACRSISASAACGSGHRLPLGSCVFFEPQGDFDQRRVVRPCTAVADKLRHHTIDDAGDVTANVLACSEPASPQVGEQRILIVGLLLGTEFGF